jgi:hypothetical protein
MIKQVQMWTKEKILKVLFVIGIIALIIGTIDPLEGSAAILAGSFLISSSMYFLKDKYWKLFSLGFILITFGVFFMFYFSSLGGFGGNSKLSWWLISLIIPYPIGWLLTIILLILKAVKKI